MELAPSLPAQRTDVDTSRILILLFCLLWSSAFAVAKLSLADCPPLLMLTARFLLAGAVILGAAVIWRVEWGLSRRDVVVLAGLGLINNAIYLGLSVSGMQSVSAGLAALIISSNPVLTTLLAAVFLGERMTWRKSAGLLLGVIGVAIVVGGHINGGADGLVGIMLVTGALVSLVAGTILFKWLAPGGSLWVGNGVQNLAGGLALAPFALAFEKLGQVVPSWRLLAAIAYLGLLVSAFGYLLWMHLLTVSGATKASAYHFLMPPLGLMFGWMLLGEHVAMVDLIGILPIALGIYLVTRHAPTASHSSRTPSSMIATNSGRMK
jgi:drug/metabolite transporter (DMT)-like permease